MNQVLEMVSFTTDDWNSYYESLGGICKRIDMAFWGMH
jgi:hypothetical protein